MLNAHPAVARSCGVEARGFCLEYTSNHGVPILSDVSFGVPHGSVLAVLGPSGCGKTTILKFLAGLLSDDAVKTSGELISEIPSEVNRPAVGLVFQRPLLFPWWTCMENIAMRPLVDLRASDMLKRVEEIVVSCELVGHEAKFPHELSGGMQQRVALAREFVRRPQLLLLDEPFSSLDVLRRSRLNDLLLKLTRASDCTTILVTHDPSEAVYIADYLLVFSDTPAAPPRFRASDLIDIADRCQMGLFAGPPAISLATGITTAGAMASTRFGHLIPPQVEAVVRHYGAVLESAFTGFFPFSCG